MYVWMCICVYVYMCICVYVYIIICMYCIYVDMYTCICIYMKYQLDIGRLDPWLFLFAQKGRCGRCWCWCCCSLCWCCRECWCWCCRWCFLVVDDDDDNNAIAILEVPDFHTSRSGSSWVQLDTHDTHDVRIMG